MGPAVATYPPMAHSYGQGLPTHPLREQHQADWAAPRLEDCWHAPTSHVLRPTYSIPLAPSCPLALFSTSLTQTACGTKQAVCRHGRV